MFRRVRSNWSPITPGNWLKTVFLTVNRLVKLACLPLYVATRQQWWRPPWPQEGAQQHQRSARTPAQPSQEGQAYLTTKPRQAPAITLALLGWTVTSSSRDVWERRSCIPPRWRAYWWRKPSHPLDRGTSFEGREAALGQVKYLSTWRDLRPSLFPVPAELKKPLTAHSRLTLKGRPTNKTPAEQPTAKKTRQQQQQRKQEFHQFHQCLWRQPCPSKLQPG